MSDPLPRKTLPSNPSLEHLRKQAKRLVTQTPGLQLAAAQHQLAQDYGFKNWAQLARVVETISGRQVRDPIAKERFDEARRLAAEGQSEKALRAMLWCLDEGMTPPSSYGAVRRSFLLSALARLGSSHPPALQALRERRDRARQNLTTEAGDASDWPDFAAINRALGEDSVTLAFYDEAKSTGAHVPPARVIYRQLSEAGRFVDAVESKPLDAFLMQFEAFARLKGNHPEIQSEHQIGHLARISGQAMEAFAGAGNMAAAHAVVERMLQTDKSADTIATLQAHAARVGHPELVPAAMH
jgi:hypothetical protein